MVAFHSRTAIGLKNPNSAHLSPRTTADLAASYGYTLHHTGYGGTLYKPEPLSRLRGIQAYHMETLGYGDIAYEGAFDADGNTYALRDNNWVGAHALGTKRGGSIPNRLTDGLVYLEDRRGWTHEAARALQWWGDVFRLVHGRAADLFAHEWWSYTSCPGSYLIDVVRYLGGSA